MSRFAEKLFIQGDLEDVSGIGLHEKKERIAFRDVHDDVKRRKRVARERRGKNLPRFGSAVHGDNVAERVERLKF